MSWCASLFKVESFGVWIPACLFYPLAVPFSSYLPMLIFLILAGVLLRLYSSDPECGVRVADSVQTEGGTWPHQSRASPWACDNLVYWWNHPAVFYRRWPGRVTPEFLCREERHSGSHHLELQCQLFIHKKWQEASLRLCISNSFLEGKGGIYPKNVHILLSLLPCVHVMSCQ